MGGGVRACSLCDPYAVVLLVDGSVVLVQLVESGRDRREDEEGEEGGDKTAELLLTWPDIKVDMHYMCADLYCMYVCMYADS